MPPNEWGSRFTVPSLYTKVMIQEQTIREMVQPLLAGTAYELMTVEVSKDNAVLVEIDQPGTVDIDFCADLNRRLNAELESNPLTKNEDYWDAGRVKLAGLNYQVIQDSQQALMSYQSGDLDTTLVNGEQVDQVKDDPEFQSIGAGYLWYVSPNIDKVSELQNLNIRMALQMAINREDVTDSVLKDGSVPTYTAVPPQFATGPDGSDFSADQEKFSDVCAFDEDKAKDYWQKGLEELGEDSIELDMIVDSDDAPQKVAQVLQEQWQTTLEGLTINITVEPKKQRVQDVQDGNFELALTRWGPDYADPMTYLGMWVTDNSNNYGLWSNADYDAIIEECTTGDLAMDAQGRWDKLYEAEQLVMDDAVIFPIYTQSNAEMISSKVTGIEFHPVALNRVYKDAVKSE